MQLYYLGPKGTFSYLACRQYFSENEATFQPKSNLFEVIKAVADDDTSIGVVPIENSIEGTNQHCGRCTCTARCLCTR
ncbi:ACT domain protein [Staphylococcus aureus]|nr:ACT domain protein [Staphylococcus aureus]